MSSIRVTTNFRDNFGTDLGDKLITKDYLMSVYPGIAQELGTTPELLAWGSGSGGVLGNTVTTGNISTPITTFAGGTNWKQVSTGYLYSAAIKTDGTLWTWGYGSSGRLGNASVANRSTPVTTFAGGTNWKQVDASISNHTAAIKTDGTLWTWGFANTGKLGNGATATSIQISTPITTFAGGTNWKQVSCGNNNVAGVKTDGTLWIGGSNGTMELGINATGNRSTPVTTFAGGTNWKQVSCGRFFTAAIKTDGTLWTWGGGSNGKLGNGATTNASTPITTFAGGTNWKQVSARMSHTAAIKTDGTLWTWGYNLNMNLGINATGNRSTPVTTFAGGTNWKQVSSGGYHTAAIKTDGTLWTWGSAANGRLGNAFPFNNVSTPIMTFFGGTNWKQVSSGGQNTTAIRTNEDPTSIVVAPAPPPPAPPPPPPPPADDN